MDEGKTSPAPWRARVRGGVLEVVDATAGENVVCTANRLADADLIAKAPTLSAELAEAQRKLSVAEGRASFMDTRAQECETRLAEAVGLLREVEWSDMKPLSAHKRCPSCLNVKELGHVTGCRMASFLAKVSR